MEVPISKKVHFKLQCINVQYTVYESLQNEESESYIEEYIESKISW